MEGKAVEKVIQGHSLLEEEKFEEALAIYEEASSLNSNCEYIMISKGIALRKLKRYNEALKCMNDATFLNPNQSLIFAIKGNCYYDQKEYTQALDNFIKENELNKIHNPYEDSTSPKVFMKEFHEAFKNYDDSLKKNPNYSPTINKRKKSIEQYEQLKLTNTFQ